VRPLLMLWLVISLGACSGKDDPSDSPQDDTDTDTDADADADTDADTDADADVDTDTDTDTDTEGTGTTGDTGTPPDPPEVLSATCTASLVHPLLADCTLTLDGPGLAQVDVTLPDGTVRPYVSTDPTTATPTIQLWGLKADTSYTWAAGTTTDSVTTGSLPAALLAVDIATTGATDAFDAILRPLTCEGARYLVMIDNDGDVVWFAENSIWNSGMHAYEWSPDTRTVMVSNHDHFEELALDGTIGLTLDRGVDFDEPLHHDLARWGPYTYLLFEYNENSVWVDGIYVFEGSTQIGEFKLGDHYVVDGGFGDWSHGNGIENGDNGELTMSLLVFDTVLGVDGDPASPTFLDVAWSAGGTTSALPGLDFAAGPGLLDGFNGQHNATRRGDQLWVFDNLSAGLSRSARYSLTAAGEVLHEESWSFDNTCPIQGGAVPVGDGVLGTCVAVNDVRYFENGVPDAVWELEVQCGQVPGIGMNRAIPVQVW